MKTDPVPVTSMLALTAMLLSACRVSLLADQDRGALTVMLPSVPLPGQVTFVHAPSVVTVTLPEPRAV